MSPRVAAIVGYSNSPEDPVADHTHQTGKVIAGASPTSRSWRTGYASNTRKIAVPIARPPLKMRVTRRSSKLDRYSFAPLQRAATGEALARRLLHANPL
jgi:hypothetical protein